MSPHPKKTKMEMTYTLLLVVVIMILLKGVCIVYEAIEETIWVDYVYKH